MFAGVTTNGSGRGTMKSLQIDAVPEPASLGAMGAMGMILLRRRVATRR